ncbi:MAG: helix-turn-helix domain-containing protein, partial [Lachnospiraceae bacterium]|nr:helix-turn-helix domain-containing protein [Lachnospiraceae bacterium]
MNTNQFNIGENIARLRHERKIRQEELADFVGVTKASVSKWENGQTMPDITILPQLASFFDIRIDELVGYEPQLSKEQIQKIYQELAAKFAKD